MIAFRVQGRPVTIKSPRVMKRGRQLSLDPVGFYLYGPRQRHFFSFSIREEEVGYRTGYTIGATKLTEKRK